MSYFEDQFNSNEVIFEFQQLLESIGGWMDVNDFHNSGTHQRFERIEQLLGDTQRNILFLAEFSRGKSELINATIFGASGGRCLPSTPGRTTRCTTELCHDPEQPPSITLLPTLGPPRMQRQAVTTLKDQSEYWTRTVFSISDMNHVMSALTQIGETETVDVDTARELGFVNTDDEEELAKLDISHDKVSIPKYRHAIVNFPNQLLTQGLSITDTPGLNAIGVEPELTVQALDHTDAIVFILSADTGVTKSELEMWTQYVRKRAPENVLVVINKIDMLWDELKTRAEIDRQLNTQIDEVARILDIPVSGIFPLSAQKALVGRSKNDPDLVDASGIKKFESALADMINDNSRKDIIEQVKTELAPVLGVIERVVKQRMVFIANQLNEIEKSRSGVNQMADDNIAVVVRDRKKVSVVSEKLSMLKVDLKVDYDRFAKRLDIFALDKLIAQYRFELSHQLTTPGLQREMNTFHDQAVAQFKDALLHIEMLQTKIVKLYEFAGEILGAKGLKPRKIHTDMYLKRLDDHQQKHLRHATGMTLVMTEQNTLRDRYYAVVMVELKRLYVQTRDEIDIWSRSVLIPLELELREKESLLKRRLLSLERIRDEKTSLNDEKHVMQSRLIRQQQFKKTLDYYKFRIDELSEQSTADFSNVIDLQSHVALQA